MMHEEENPSEVLEMIKRLMEELSEKMEYSADDFEERLGRKKPEVEVSVLKGEMPPEEEAEEFEEMPEMEDEDDEAGMLKKRLMRLGKG